MVALKKMKAFYLNLNKSKISSRKPTKAPKLKHFNLFDSSMQLKFDMPAVMEKNWEAEYEIKEIFKNGIYRNKSNISMDLSDSSAECEYNLTS